MFRKIILAGPVLSAMALLTPAMNQPVQAAQFSHAFDAASSPLLELVQILPKEEERGRGRGGGGGDRPGRGGGGGGERNFGGGERRGGGGDGGGIVRRAPGGGGDGIVRRGRGDGGGGMVRPGGGAGGGRDVNRGGDRGKGYDRQRIRRFGRAHRWGPGITFWFYDGYYYGDCDWLRRRAIVTGSRYWWQRYRQCRVYSW